ncbi:derriere protein-like [Discoglossus pictus]
MEAYFLRISSLALFLVLTASSEIPFHERMLLKALGLDRRPNPVAPGPVPRTLWDVFEKGIDQNKPCRMDAFGVPGNILRSYRDQGDFASSEMPKGPLCVKKHLFFDLTAVEKKEQLTLGRLEIKFTHNTYHGGVFTLNLYRTLQMSLKGMREKKMNRKLLASQSFHILHKSLYLPLTKVVKDWLNPGKNMGLVLEILAEGNGTAGTMSPCEQVRFLTDTSLLTVSLDPTTCKNTPRARRQIDSSMPTPSNICKKRRLYIDFKDVGWQNWVIAPRGYMANYCHGECPYPLTEMLRGTNHAVLQTLVHSIEPETTPLPCCAPTKLSPISMLYYDNNDNVVLRHYEDMVVDECGCK